MTAAGLHHLPTPDDGVFQRLLDALADEDFDLTPGRRTVLAALHEFGWLAGQDGVAGMMRELMERETREAKAAASRRQVRAHRAEASAEAKFHASLPRLQDTRLWSPTEDGFTCHLCGQTFGRYVDSLQAVSAAVDHTRTCGGATDD